MAWAGAAVLAASFLTLKLLFFLAIMTLNLSKSFRAALFVVAVNFLAKDVLSHFSSNFASAQAFLSELDKDFYFKRPDLAPLGILITCLVRVSLVTGYIILGNPLEGPSTNTLLLSAISTMTTTLP